MRRIACIGDSNTVAVRYSPSGSWCEQIAAHDPAHWQVWNGSVIGLSAYLVAEKVWPNDPKYVAYATDPANDGVLIALGTNDVARGRTSEQIIAALAFLYAQNNDGGRRQVWILTIPCQTNPALQAATDVVNAAIHAHFGKAVIDVGCEALRPDGIHLTPAAETQRADRLWSILTGG